MTNLSSDDIRAFFITNSKNFYESVKITSLLTDHGLQPDNSGKEFAILPAQASILPDHLYNIPKQVIDKWQKSIPQAIKYSLDWMNLANQILEPFGFRITMDETRGLFKI